MDGPIEVHTIDLIEDVPCVNDDVALEGRVEKLGVMALLQLDVKEFMSQQLSDLLVGGR